MPTLDKTDNAADILLARALVEDVRVLYPDFDRWFDSTCVRQIASGEAALIVAREAGETVGVAIGKNTAEEIKLRCVYVAPSHRGTGLGVRLVKAMLSELACPVPIARSRKR
jgi:GNAT superfamily N-acetyltransferase